LEHYNTDITNYLY